MIGNMKGQLGELQIHQFTLTWEMGRCLEKYQTDNFKNTQLRTS